MGMQSHAMTNKAVKFVASRETEGVSTPGVYVPHLGKTIFVNMVHLCWKLNIDLHGSLD